MGTPLSEVHSHNREFDLSLHILEHVCEGREPRYTVGAWHGPPGDPSLRALCHVAPISGAMLAISRELSGKGQTETATLQYPQWSRIVDLVERLRSRKDPDSETAADEIEDTFGRLHNTVADLECALNRLTRLGALIEEVAAKANVVENEGARCRSVVITETLWLKLLTNYRHRQEGCAVYRELQTLRELAGIAADTLTTIDNWLGSAGTRESAMDALWRLTRILQGMGYQLPHGNLRWRGQLVRAVEEAGFGLGSDGALRVRQPEDKYWEPVTGALVRTIVQPVPQPISRSAPDLSQVGNYAEDKHNDGPSNVGQANQVS
jgi:hypothetical protein